MTLTSSKILNRTMLGSLTNTETEVWIWRFVNWNLSVSRDIEEAKDSETGLTGDTNIEASCDINIWTLERK